VFFDSLILYISRDYDLAEGSNMTVNRRPVNYDRSILTYFDILGFSELIEKKSAGDISRSIRVVREAAEPRRFKSAIEEVPEADFRNFSDLCIIRKVIASPGKFPASGEVFSQILHVVHVQANLLFDEGILLRGGITVGDVALSYGQLFGPAVVRAYAIESQIARFPRVVVGEEVLNELRTNPALVVHDPEYDLKETRRLLRRDFDGEYFVDYLRVIEQELDDRSEYPALLGKHDEFIKRGLKRYRSKPSILAKYKWLREYHRYTTKKWEERNRAKR
jgi:hypothetical protein